MFNAVKCNLTELTTKSGCVPLKGLVDLLSTRASAFTYVNVPSCPMVFHGAHAPVLAAGVYAPLHLALFVHAHTPVHAWSHCW